MKKIALVTQLLLGSHAFYTFGPSLLSQSVQSQDMGRQMIPPDSIVTSQDMSHRIEEPGQEASCENFQDPDNYNHTVCVGDKSTEAMSYNYTYENVTGADENYTYYEVIEEVWKDEYYKYIHFEKKTEIETQSFLSKEYFEDNFGVKENITTENDTVANEYSKSMSKEGPNEGDLSSSVFVKKNNNTELIHTSHKANGTNTLYHFVDKKGIYQQRYYEYHFSDGSFQTKEYTHLIPLGSFYEEYTEKPDGTWSKENGYKINNRGNYYYYTDSTGECYYEQCNNEQVCERTECDQSNQQVVQYENMKAMYNIKLIQE